MPEFGEVNIIPNTDLSVEWTMDGFITLFKLGGEFWSPGFHFEGHLWCLVIYLNRCRWEEKVVCVSLFLNRLSPGAPAQIPVDFSISLKTANGEKFQEQNCTRNFQLFISDLHGFPEFMTGSELLKELEKAEVLPFGALTVVCTLQKPASVAEIAEPAERLANAVAESEEGDVNEEQKNNDVDNEEEEDDDEWEDYDDEEYENSDDEEYEHYDAEGEESYNSTDENDDDSEDNDADKVECGHCKERISADSISSHERSCMRRHIKCPDCFEVLSLQKWLHNHECQNVAAEGEGSLSHDFKNVLLNGLNHDVILKVSDGEFPAHRDILRARSQVFNSMLTHDMIEKNSGTISILDCDSKLMKQFLSYIYSGKVETLDQSTVHELFYVADKYNVKGLKKECCNYMKLYLSPTNICEAIQIATDHSESNLLEFITEYMMNNMKHIVCTTEWQSFFKDNTTVADDLIRKSLSITNFCEVFQFAFENSYTNLLEYTVEYFKKKQFIIMRTAAFNSFVEKNDNLIILQLLIGSS